MNLPIVYRDTPGTGRVLSVDGAFGAPGLNLSHWPGNQTPVDLKHELSTGIALNFVRLPAADQERLTAGCEALVNNHFDTDGLLSLFVMSHPELALAHADRLLQFAAAGDFFEVPSEEAFCFDHLVTLYVDTDRSPLVSRFAGLSDMQRYSLVTEHLFDRLPQWLEQGLNGEAHQTAQALGRLREDLASIEAAEAVPLVHFDLTVYLSAQGPGHEPGRHALFQKAHSDRVLWLSKVAATGQAGSTGTLARFLIGTRSWFEIPGHFSLVRPDLAELSARLNALEPAHSNAKSAWQHHPAATASPEVWFGQPDVPLFTSYPGQNLEPSLLSSETIKGEVCEALRKVWVFENEDNTTDADDIYAV